MQHTSILLPLSILYFLPFHSCWYTPKAVPHLYSCLLIIVIIITILGLSYTNEWEGTRDQQIAHVVDLLFLPFCYKWHNIIFLYGQVIFHCTYIPYFLYSFISCWAPQLFPQLGYYEDSCNKLGYGDISLTYQFKLLQIHG
jgi:hypothetical protein